MSCFDWIHATQLHEHNGKGLQWTVFECKIYSELFSENLQSLA